MFLDVNQIQELQDIIEKQNILFIGSQVGSSALTDKDKKILKSFGIKVNKLPKQGKVDESFHFGILADVLGDAVGKRMTYEQLKKRIKEGKFLPLTEAQELALNNIKQQAAQDIRALGNRMSHSLGKELVEIDKLQRQKYNQLIISEAQKAIKNKDTVKQLAIRLSKNLSGYAENFQLISDYILHVAYDNGIALSLKRKFGGNALCYKEVLNTACKHCRRLYLKPNGEPIIFTVDELLKNGTNIGRKANKYRAVVGAIHPRCRCSLKEYNKEMKWNNRTKSFELKRETYGVNRKSKAKVTIKYI